MTGTADGAALISAGGKEKLVKTDLAKVLHHLGGRPLVYYIVESVRGCFEGEERGNP